MSHSYDKLNKNELLEAISNKNPKIFQELLLRHQNCYFPEDFLEELISKAAAECDNEEIIELLMNLIKLITEYRETEDDLSKYLKIALTAANVKLVESLLKNGAEMQQVSWKYDCLMTYLYRIIFKSTENRSKIVKLLIDYGQMDIDIRERLFQENILHSFIRHFVDEDDQDAAEVAEVFLDAGVPIDEAIGDPKGAYTPLLLAIMTKNIKLISFLIQRGADLHTEVNNPLTFAARSNNVKIADLFLKANASINFKDNSGSTALHTACCGNRDKMIRLLIRNGADINAKDWQDRTPLGALLMQYSENRNFDQCVAIVTRELAKLSFEDIPVCESDMNLITEKQPVREYFDKCLQELSLMKNKIFFSPYSYYHMLKTSRNSKKLAKLTKNENFVENFKANLSLFPNYTDDLRKIFDEIIQFRDEMLNVQTRLKSIFGDFLPDVILRKLADNLTAQDLPIE